MMNEELPDDKALKIRKAVNDALILNGATNQHGFDALSVNLVILLRGYPLGMREAHLDMFYTRVVEGAFAEVLGKEASHEQATA